MRPMNSAFCDIELLEKISGNFGLDAKQHAIAEGGVGFGQAAVDQRLATGAQRRRASGNGAGE